MAKAETATSSRDDEKGNYAKSPIESAEKVWSGDVEEGYDGCCCSCWTSERERKWDGVWRCYSFKVAFPRSTGNALLSRDSHAVRSRYQTKGPAIGV